MCVSGCVCACVCVCGFVCDFFVCALFVCLSVCVRVFVRWIPSIDGFLILSRSQKKYEKIQSKWNGLSKSILM